jgi:hypothetical protein
VKPTLFQYVRCLCSWSRIDSVSYEFVESNFSKPWFSPLFWAFIVGLLVIAIQLIFSGSLLPINIFVFAIIGSMFGIWLKNLDPGLSKEARALEEKAVAGDWDNGFPAGTPRLN